MRNPEMQRHLDSLAPSRSSAGPKSKVALERLEVYTSQMVVPWLQGEAEETLRSLIRSNLFENVCDATEYVHVNLPCDVNPDFFAAWRSFASLVDRVGIVTDASGAISHPYVALFISSIVLRSAFDALSERVMLSKALISIEEHRVAVAFVNAVQIRAMAEHVPLPVDPAGVIAVEILRLPFWLDGLVLPSHRT